MAAIRPEPIIFIIKDPEPSESSVLESVVEEREIPEPPVGSDSSRLESLSFSSVNATLRATSVMHVLTRVEGAEKFKGAIKEAKESWGIFGAGIHPYDSEKYQTMDLILFHDCSAGCAVTEKREIVSVFKHKENCSDPEPLKTLFPLAIAKGGNRLDCYNIRLVLPLKYSLFGFIPVAKVKFDKQYAPPDWDYDKLKEPDIIMMVLDREQMGVNPETGLSERDDRVEVIEEIIAKLDYSASYDEAIEITVAKAKEIENK